MLTRREMINARVLRPRACGRRRAWPQDVNDIVLNPSPAVVPFTRRLKIPRPHLPLNRPGATRHSRWPKRNRFSNSPSPRTLQARSVSAQQRLRLLRSGDEIEPQEIVPGTFTPIYGYNGTFPGPTFISQRDACIRFVNRTGNIIQCTTTTAATRPPIRTACR